VKYLLRVLHLHLLSTFVLLLSAEDGVPAGGVTVSRLFRALSDSSVSVLLMDVRSRDDFNASHVKTADCINIPADCVQLGFVCRLISVKSFANLTRRVITLL